MSQGSVTTVQVIGRTVKPAYLQSFLQIKASLEKSHVYFLVSVCVVKESYSIGPCISLHFTSALAFV